MRGIRANKTFFETPNRVDALLYSHSYVALTRGGVSYSLFHPLTEKGNVVNMKSEVQIKRVCHALHDKTPYRGCGCKSSSHRVEGKRVCSVWNLQLRDTSHIDS